jgi:hypothetical protein
MAKYIANWDYIGKSKFKSVPEQEGDKYADIITD